MSLERNISTKKGAIITVIIIIVAFFSGVVFDRQYILIRSYFDPEYKEAQEEQEKKLVRRTDASSIKDVDFDIFWEAWSYVKGEYAGEDVTDAQLFYGAMEGLVYALEDPYSMFLEPKTSEEFQKEISGSFDGIGAEIGIRNNVLTIISPLTGSPADNAGLKAGDKVLEIDGESTQNMSLFSAVENIRGEKGTTVDITVYRDNEDDTRTISVVRDEIDIESVEWKMLDGNIAYIQLKHFNTDTLGDFAKAANDVVSKKSRGIILDLRNNPGGLLRTAVEIASYWIGGDQIIVIEKNRGEDIVGEKAINENAYFENLPTVVLVNRGSASGSEILAGALQDYGLAVVVGETTFGKGSVQDFRTFRDGSSIKLTVAEWLTPSGRHINGVGIDPDREVELTEEDWNNDKDPQLDEAVSVVLNATVE